MTPNPTFRRAAPWAAQDFEFEAEDDARGAYEASRRALREAVERLDRDCSGQRVLQRLRKEPLDFWQEARELQRLQHQLADAQQSGSARRVAQARCEMAAFRWETWGRPFKSRQMDAYQEVTRLVKSAQWQLGRERWLLQRWHCQAWPLLRPLPESVRVGCERQQRRVDAATAELARLELRRTRLEDDILLGR
jgi:hypothetical protein